MTTHSSTAHHAERRWRMSKNRVKWHPYPQEKPKKDGIYLITHRYGNKIGVSMAYVTKNFNSDNLIAWAEKPEPYNPKENNNESR